jgi:hypothetical protein
MLCILPDGMREANGFKEEIVLQMPPEKMQRLSCSRRMWQGQRSQKEVIWL